MPYPTITLRANREDSILRRHAWIFSGAIAHVPPDVQSGSVVRVCSHRGDFLAVGHYQPSTIAVRILSWKDENIDQHFWQTHIQSALQTRQTLNLTNDKLTNAYRLVHGEGDNLPGLIVDCYNDTAVIQAHSMGMHLSRKDIAEAIIACCGPTVHNVYYKSETTLPNVNNSSLMNGYIIGHHETDVAKEDGLSFHINWVNGQKTGFFLDQRNNRLMLERYARDRRVLNMFCYTGGFSCYAMRGGASEVVSVDSSEKAIELVKANIALNFGSDTRHRAICQDAFKFLNNIENPYDVIVLDPPAFAKHRGAIHNALKGYTRLNCAGIQQLSKGGILFTFSCSQAINMQQFRAAVLNAALQAQRTVRILHQLHQPEDHPISIAHPESEYLKGLVLYVE